MSNVDEMDETSDDEEQNTPQLIQPSTLLSRKRGETLERIPFVVPFMTRVQVFREWINQDMGDDDYSGPSARVNIRRDHVFHDGFNALHPLTSTQLKKRVAISFTDNHGMTEAGIDGGGVFKEFLNTLSRVAFDGNYGLFKTGEDNSLYPNPSLNATNAAIGSEVGSGEVLRYFEFLGRILGKALYDGTCLLSINYQESSST
jgi:ubiquitin-protein ligase E3 C